MRKMSRGVKMLIDRVFKIVVDEVVAEIERRHRDKLTDSEVKVIEDFIHKHPEDVYELKKRVELIVLAYANVLWGY
jgi:hypothetical protein